MSFGTNKGATPGVLGDGLESCQNRDNYRERGNFSPVIITTDLVNEHPDINTSFKFRFFCPQLSTDIMRHHTNIHSLFLYV